MTARSVGPGGGTPVICCRDQHTIARAVGESWKHPSEWLNLGNAEPVDTGSGPSPAIVRYDQTSGRQRRRQLPARGDVQFPEHLAQVVFDGGGGHEQVGGYLDVGRTHGGQPADLSLLRREVRAGSILLRTGPVTGRELLGPGPVGESR